MPYLLGIMNLLLHGIEKPNIKRDNSLRTPLYEITEKDRVNVIMTNPPFGGEEEKGIMSNFPESTRTAETASLFLQYIMRKLKDRGRCGMVVPDGTLFDTGIGARIKKELLDNFNLHTIVRLPKGVFSPYADIKTNLLFFEKDGPTKDIWFYEHALPLERQDMQNPCYTKTSPLTYEEFEPLQQWWNDRKENEHAWRVSVESIIKINYNLDLKNPRSQEKDEWQSPQQLADRILEKEKEIIRLMTEIRQMLDASYE
jgi:type I restriction enzyme M protein